jgi:alanine racemase
MKRLKLFKHVCQVSFIKELLVQLQEVGVTFQEVHIANSDGVHNIDSSHKGPFTMVRTGINLYGYFDLEGRKRFNLTQVLTLKSKLIAIRELPKGTTIGYGRTFQLSRNTRVGTVAIGYADGLPIALSKKGFLSVRGMVCPIIGRVSMDYTTIDLTEVEDAEIGDDVICLGKSFEVNEWALQADTITYDIICSIGARVKRVYLEKKPD